MFIDCIMNRRAIRTYTDEPVTQTQLEMLLKAGMAAPSAMNTQPWHFIVLTEPAIKDRIADICEYWGPLAKAPVGIVVAADLGIARAEESFVVQDCSAATENILCAACGLGLGGVWLGLYGVNERVTKVKDALSLPPNMLPVTLVAIGHPAQDRKPHDEFYAEKVHYDKF